MHVVVGLGQMGIITPTAWLYTARKGRQKANKQASYRSITAAVLMEHLAVN